MAAFHAAQALIHARNGRAPKTHSGVRTIFSQLAQSEPAINAQLVSFLGRSYELKDFTDYGNAPRITIGPADDVLTQSATFVATIERLLNGEEGSGAAPQ